MEEAKTSQQVRSLASVCIVAGLAVCGVPRSGAGGHRHAQTALMGSMCCVQVAHHGSRREMRPPAEKTTSYFNLFAVSACGLIRKLELDK